LLACYYFRMPRGDTTPEIQAMQDRIIMAMTGEQRLKMALELSLFARALAKARITREHPEWSEKQVTLELLRLAFFPKPLPEWVK
jgi:Rv0078B-related antitoxin